MAIAFVAGQKANANSTPAVATLAVSYPANTTVGSLLCAHAGALNAITSVTDNKSGGSNTWVNDIAVVDANVGTDEAWHSFNAGVCLTVTIHFATTSSFCFVAVSEFSGAQTASDPKDQVSERSDGGTAAASTTVDVTPSTNGQLCFVINRDTGAGTDTANSPFTQLSQSGQADCDAYEIQTTATARHADFNNTGDTHWHVGIVTFKPPAAAAPILQDLAHRPGQQVFMAT